MVEPMECEHREQMTAQMSMALDNLLGADEHRLLHEHLAACPRCQAEWKAMQAVSWQFEQAPMVGPPLGFAIRVERRLNEKSKRRRRAFGGVAVLTGSLSLASVTIAAVALLIMGLVIWNISGPLPGVQQGTHAVSQVASGMGLVGKGASLFLWDLLVRFGPPLLFVLGIGLTCLVGVWVWLFIKRPGSSHRNGYV